MLFDILNSLFHPHLLAASKQGHLQARTTLRLQSRSSEVNQEAPAGIHSLLNRVYASGGYIGCAPYLGEISVFSDLVTCVWILLHVLYHLN